MLTLEKKKKKTYLQTMEGENSPACHSDEPKMKLLSWCSWTSRSWGQWNPNVGKGLSNIFPAFLINWVCQDRDIIFPWLICISCLRFPKTPVFGLWSTSSAPSSEADASFMLNRAIQTPENSPLVEKTPSPGAGKEKRWQQTWSFSQKIQERKMLRKDTTAQRDFISSKECFGLTSFPFISLHTSQPLLYIIHPVIVEKRGWRKRRTTKNTEASQFTLALQSPFQKRAIRRSLIQEIAPSSCLHIAAWE